VVISEGVTHVGAGTFGGEMKINVCHNLISVTLPSTLQTIGKYAFGGSAITSITLPTGLTSLDEDAFSGYDYLTAVEIPYGITSIQNSTFYYCDSLSSVTIPETMTSIEQYAFDGCFTLDDVYYTGTMAQWGAVSIDPTDNNSLLAATIHCWLSKKTMQSPAGKPPCRGLCCQ